MMKSSTSTTGWHRVLAAVFYGVCSAAMAFANKAVITSYEFNFPFAIMAVQMLVSVVIIMLLSYFNVIEVPAYTFHNGKMFLVPSICAVLHSCLSLFALGRMNIPMYGALKRCTPLVNLVLAVLVLNKPFPTIGIITSILLITVGCLVAGFGDLSFDVLAYSVGSISVVVQGLYQTLIQKTYEKNISTLQIFQLNCYNSLPLYVLGSLFMFEITGIAEYKRLLDVGFLSCLILVALLGSVMNFSLFLSTSLTSALTTSLVGVMKSVLQTVIGFFTFGGVAFNPLNVFGIVMNIFGGFLYSYCKYQEGSTVAEKRDSSTEEQLLKNGNHKELV